MAELLARFERNSHAPFGVKRFLGSYMLLLGKALSGNVSSKDL